MLKERNMAEYICELTDPVAALAGVGVAFVAAVDGDAAVSDIATVIPEPERQAPRAELVAQPPVAGEEFSGMGAWHKNDVNEAHTVTSGRGYLEFVTHEGIVGVIVTAGDVMLVQGAEHRYLPLEPQGWIIRHGAAPEGDMAPVDTGRADTPWPSL